jgi:hypothetical protein
MSSQPPILRSPICLSPPNSALAYVTADSWALALSLIGVRGFANMNAPKTLDSGIPDFPISDGSVRASPPGYSLTIRPLPMTVINPLIGVSEFVTSRCTCIRNLRSSDSRYAFILARSLGSASGPQDHTI